MWAHKLLCKYWVRKKGVKVERVGENTPTGRECELSLFDVLGGTFTPGNQGLGLAVTSETWATLAGLRCCPLVTAKSSQ